MNEEEAFENGNIREQADNRSSNQLTTEALKELSKWKALVASTAATFEFLPSISLYESEQNGPWASDAKSLTASDPSNSFDSLDGSNEDEQISHTPDGPEDNNLANLYSSHGLDNQDNSNGLDNQDSNGLDNQDSNGLDNQYNSDGLEDPDSPDDRDRNPDDSEINDSRDEKAPSVKTEFGDDFSEKRSFVANGHRVMVKTIPDFKLDNSPYTHSVREVTIDGKRVRLTATAQEWFYSRSAKNLQGDAENMPKIHIRADSPADLAKVQASVIPVLEKLIDQGKIGQYKTFDPNFADVRWAASTSKAGPGPEVQSSKGFTVYLPKEFAVEVSGIIDRALVSQDLKVRFEGNGSVGDTWRKHTASARVSMERANWEFVKPSLNSNRIFHLLDASVEKVLIRKFEKYRDKDGKMSPEGLNEIEKASGVEQGKLAIEPGTGRIALVSRIDRGAEGSPYVDESQANKEPGFKTGRPAMYALHELAGIDPVLAELGAQPDQRSSKEIPKIISKENTAHQAKKAVELNLIEVLENTYNKLAHGKTRAEREQARAMLEHLSNSENRETRELAGLVKKAAASSVGIRAEGLEPKTFRELMQEHQIDLEQAKTGRKVLVGVGLGVGFATTLGAGLSWLNSNRNQVAPIRDAAPKIEKK